MLSERGRTRLGISLVACVVCLLCLAIALPGAAGAEENTVTIEEVTPSFVQSDQSSVTVTYTAQGPDIGNDDVTLRFTDVAGNEFTVEGTSGKEVEQTVVIPGSGDRVPGPYDVTVETGVKSDTEEEAFEVAPRYTPDDAEFRFVTHTTSAGDQVYVNVTMNDIGEAYLVIGGDRPPGQHQVTNYLDVLHIDGSTTFRINTRLLGTDRPNDAVFYDPNGDVTSYTHTYGADTPAAETEEFENFRFETEDYEQVGDSLADFQTAVNITTLPGPLQPGSYSMALADGNALVIREDGITDPRQPLDRAALELTEPGIEGMTVYRHPTGNANEMDFFPSTITSDPLGVNNTDELLAEATETNHFAIGDRIVLDIEATGLYGALLDENPTLFPRRSLDQPSGMNPAEFGSLLRNHEGVELELTETNPGPNNRSMDVDLLDADGTDVYLVPARTTAPPFPDPEDIEQDATVDETLEPFVGEPVADRFLVVIDTRGAAPFEEPLTGGERFEVTFSYESPPGETYRFQATDHPELPPPFDPQNTPTDGVEHYPYFTAQEETVSVSETLTVEQPRVEYNRTTADGRPILETGNATLSGVTNIAPAVAQEIAIIFDVRQEPTKVVAENVNILSNGTFEVTEDLSSIDPEDDVEITFRAYQRVLDEREAYLIEPNGDASNFVVEQLETRSETTANETTANVTATVTNVGAIQDNRTVELFIDDEPVDSARLDLRAGSSETVAFDVPNGAYGPGNHVVQVRTPHDNQTQLLVVQEPTTNFTIESFAVDSPVTAGDPLAVNATLRNNGTVRGRQEVRLLVGQTELGDETVDAFDGETVRPAFADVTAQLDPGKYRLTLQTDTDEATVDLTVEPVPGELLVADLSVDSPVTPETPVNATTTIANTAGSEQSGMVTVTLDGEQRQTMNVTLTGDSEETIEIGEAIGSLSAGNYSLTVETQDDEQTVEFVVDSEGSESNGDESGTSGTSLFGLGIGTRELAVGTATVGAIHVLGYWV
jgi:hypothetical protein